VWLPLLVKVVGDTPDLERSAKDRRICRARL
jgi:hypothetical protein